MGVQVLSGTKPTPWAFNPGLVAPKWRDAAQGMAFCWPFWQKPVDFVDGSFIADIGPSRKHLSLTAQFGGTAHSSYGEHGHMIRFDVNTATLNLWASGRERPGEGFFTADLPHTVVWCGRLHDNTQNMKLRGYSGPGAVGDTFFELGFESGDIVYRWNDWSSPNYWYLTSTGGVPANEEDFILVGQFDGKTARCFLNGVEVLSAAAANLPSGDSFSYDVGFEPVGATAEASVGSAWATTAVVPISQIMEDPHGIFRPGIFLPEAGIATGKAPVILIPGGVQVLDGNVRPAFWDAKRHLVRPEWEWVWNDLEAYTPMTYVGDPRVISSSKQVSAPTYGAGVSLVHGAHGRVIDFDASTTARLSFPAGELNLTGDLTVAVLYRDDGGDAGDTVRTLIGLENWSAAETAFAMNRNSSGNLAGYFTDTAFSTRQVTTPYSNMDDGKWHMAVYTRSRPINRIYDDHTMVEASLDFGVNSVPSNQACIGALDLTVQPWSGQIAGAWIWSRALTQSEVHRFIDKPFAGFQPDFRRVYNVSTVTASPVGIYESFREYLADGTFDMDGHTFKVDLTTSAYAPSLGSHTQLSQVTNVLSGNGYATQTLSGVTWNRSGGTVTFDFNDPIFTATGGSLSPRYAVLWSETAVNDELVAVFDLGASVTIPSGEGLRLEFAALTVS